MKPQKSKPVLTALFKSFNKKYLDDVLRDLEPVEISEAHKIAHDPNFNKTIAEVKYNFSKN